MSLEEFKSGQANNAKSLQSLSFPTFRFDRDEQKYYHARLMSARAIIDSLEFAQAARELRGSLPVSSLVRLQDFLRDSTGSVEFAVKGGHDPENRPVLALSVSGLLHMQCQRCLERLDYPLRYSTTLRLVQPGEDLSETIADPDAVDVVKASMELDVAELIEDELLLSLPFSPRHAEGTCDSRKKDTRGTAEGGAFSGLAALKNVLDKKP